METIFNGFNEFKKNLTDEDKNLYQGLEGGQSPHTLLITCSDSRISVAEVTNSKAGDVFVIRNAGNVIEGYNPQNPSNEALTLEYGINALGIKEVVVCGHAKCGAMGGVQALETLDALPLVKKGLERVAEQFKGTDVKSLSGEEMIELNVVTQIKNLISYPFVREKVESGDLQVWGWVYDFVNNEITFKKNAKEIL